MWQDGEITAMLDWEMALNGEPLADLGYMLYSFESRLSRRYPRAEAVRDAVPRPK